MADTEAKNLIPLPILVRLYRRLRRCDQAHHLRWGLWLEQNPAVLARWVAESIDVFSEFDNKVESFCAHRPLDAVNQITNGRELLRALATGGTPPGAWPIRHGKEKINLSFVDYEVPPARTTQKAPLFLNQFAAKGGDSISLTTDLLLKHPDGTPVVGEAKVAKVAGYDTDSLIALIQALAAACLFATPHQLARMSSWYGTAATARFVDVALFLYKPAILARSTYQFRLDALAWLLAHRVMEQPVFPDAVRAIYFVHVTGAPSNLAVVAVAAARKG